MNENKKEYHELVLTERQKKARMEYLSRQVLKANQQAKRVSRDMKDIIEGNDDE